MIELAERIQILRRYTTAVRRPMELDELVSLGFVCGEALRAEAKVAELEKDLTKITRPPVDEPKQLLGDLLDAQYPGTTWELTIKGGT